MSFNITKNTGNGKLAQAGLISYSYSEEVTSLEPSSSSGGTGQLTFIGIANNSSSGYDISNSKLMINNSMRLNDSDKGEIEFQVKKLSTTAGAVTITGDTIQSRLNVEKTALPILSGGGTSLKETLFSLGFDSLPTGTLATNVNSYFPINTSSNYIGFGSYSGLENFSIDSTPSLGNAFTIECSQTSANTTFDGIGWSTLPFGEVTLGSPTVIASEGFSFEFDIKSNHAGTYLVSFWGWNTNSFIMRQFSVSGTGEFEHITLDIPPYPAGAPESSLYAEFNLGVPNMGSTGTDIIGPLMSTWSTYVSGQTFTYPVISNINETLGNSLSFANFQFSKTSGSATVQNGNLHDTIQYYCSLVGVTPGFDGSLGTELTNIPVNFLGWTGNVWEKLKQLCAVASSSLTDNAGIEMYVNLNQLRFRKAINRDVDFLTGNNLIDLSVSVDSFDAAKEIVIYNYNTEYHENKVIFESSNYDENGKRPDGFKASITDSMQVNSGETLVKRFQINAHLISVNQPVNVDIISSLPYNGTSGEYVIVDSNNTLVTASEWAARNGVLNVSLTENPDEIEVKNYCSRKSN